MFDLAFKSHIPIIGVQTDDLVNFEATLTRLTGLKVQNLTSAATKLGGKLYWSDSLDLVTVSLYNKLMEGEHQLIIVNSDKKSSLVFDAGTLPTPQDMVVEYLEAVLGTDSDIVELLQVLKGLSLKSIGEIVMLTQARTGATLAPEVRRTRTMVSGGVQGLYSLDTAIDFYQFPEKLEGWLKLNQPYFLTPQTPPKLVPRGVLLDGSPGVGKSLAAKAIANHYKIPLYRLDIATTLNRYIGESENRISRSLQMIERESPCVLLIDEVEKVFGNKDDSGVTERILSQLLWWLADHTSRILTVMTTNNLKSLPPELYRQGRIDLVMRIPRLSLTDAQQFAQLVYLSVIGSKPTIARIGVIIEGLKISGNDDYSHAEVAELVYTEIKRHSWLVD